MGGRGSRGAAEGAASRFGDWGAFPGGEAGASAAAATRWETKGALPRIRALPPDLPAPGGCMLGKAAGQVSAGPGLEGAGGRAVPGRERSLGDRREVEVPGDSGVASPAEKQCPWTRWAGVVCRFTKGTAKYERRRQNPARTLLRESEAAGAAPSSGGAESPRRAPAAYRRDGRMPKGRRVGHVVRSPKYPEHFVNPN